MANTEIVRRLKKIISEKLAVSEDRIIPEASFVDDLGADSLGQVELIQAYEDAFDIEIKDKDAEAIMTFQNAVDCVDEYVNQKT